MPDLRLAVADGVATLTLVDPGGVNALDDAFVAALRAQVEAVTGDPSVHVLVLRAEAAAFSAGGDIRWFAAMGDGCHDGITALVGDVTALIATLHASDTVTVAAVHGAVAGGGLGIALACDIVVAAEATTFAMAYGRIGASPDLGVSSFLVRDVGYRRAVELCVLAEILSAEEALALGLANRVVPRDALDDVGGALARRITAGPWRANATAKRLLRSAARTALADQLGDELRAVADLSRTGDWREGIAAFLEGRDPVFGATAPAPAAR